MNGKSGSNGVADKKIKKKKVKPVLEEVPENGNDSQSKFARALASTDYQTREKGLQALTLWMVHRPEISEKEMLRIWKGLFYCFWHADKAPVQVSRAVACPSRI
jgi:ribosomal RNA-processing protein 1